MKQKFFLCGALVSIILLSEVFQGTFAQVSCPSTLPMGNMDDPANYSAAEMIIFENMWNQFTTGLSEKAQAMKDVLFFLATSNVQRWHTVAFAASSWIWSYWPKDGCCESLCGIARMINATVAWQKSNDCAVLLEAQDILAKNAEDANQFSAAAALRNVGCGCSFQPHPREMHCYKDGSIYMIKQLWALNGKNYPCNYQKAALDLYCSPCCKDRLMAAAATLSISEPYLQTVMNTDKLLKLKQFTMQSTFNMDSTCCAEFERQIEDTKNTILAQITAGVELSKTFTHCGVTTGIILT